jgi:hypothetical protein
MEMHISEFLISAERGEWLASRRLSDDRVLTELTE